MIGLRTGLKVLAVALIVVACGIGTAGADPLTIDTTGGWDGANFQGYFGAGDPSINTPTWGQVVTAPANSNVLQSFTFYMGQDPNFATGAISFVPYVYKWDSQNLWAIGTGPTATPLWRGTAQQVTVNALQPFTFTPGIAVTPGTQYVLFASVSEYAGGNSGGGIWGLVGGGGTSDTYFVFYNDGGNTSLWTTAPWDTSMNYQALAMQAQFGGSAVPVPAAILLFGPGLVGLDVVRRRLNRSL